MAKDNSGWPESFGFSIAGDAPVVVVAVLENSVARNYGLNVGDQILEIDGKNVRGLSKEHVTLLARRSKQVPPSVAVISRIRTFRMKRRRHVGFGMTLRGSKPVYVQSVMKNSPAYQAGICPGDMFLKVNGRSVKSREKSDVKVLIERAGNSINLMMIAGNYAIRKFEDRFSSNSLARYKRSREFFVKMNYYLTGEEHKKTLLVALLKRYARDRDIERFSRLVSSLLTSDVQRRLLQPVRYFIPTRHKPYFDAIVNQNYSRSASEMDSPRLYDENSLRGKASKYGGKSPRTSPRAQLAQKPWLATSTPYAGNDKNAVGLSKGSGKLPRKEPPIRSVNLKRESGSSSFGFTLSGCRPVFIRSVDDGGPAVQADLRPGDCVLEINGINVRNASHESVIELFKSSGTSPTIVVQWRPLPENLEMPPMRPRGNSDGSELRQSQGGDSFTDSALEMDLSPRNGYLGNSDKRSLNSNAENYDAELVRHLNDQMKKLLTRGEQLVVKQALAFFHKDRDVSKLVGALEPVLDDPLKLQMLHCISRLLPGPAQLEFEKQAVDMVSRQMENGIIISATTDDHEIFDILFRVQGSKLAETNRPRNLIGGLVDVKADSSWPSSKGVSTSYSTGSFGSDLDQTPSRDTSRRNEVEELKETPIKDSTFDALMSIDEDRFLQDSNKNRNSTVITNAMVHSSQGRQKSSASKNHGGAARPSDGNNNNNDDDDVFTDEGCESNGIDDLHGNASGKLRHPSQKDIDELKRELLLAQEEARKAQKEAEEKGVLLENRGITTDNGATAAIPATKGPTSITDAIKEKSFEMEADKVKSASTDDHVILPGQFPPPGVMPPPPPPPPPAPPAPPPPPGIGGKNAMQLKRINWEKVSAISLENTVWGKLGSEDEVDGIIDFRELEQLFGTKKQPVKEKKVEKKKTSILESKKSYNLSILLGHLKMPVEELHDAVLSIDETKLTEPHIQTLLMCAPEGNEIEGYKSFSGDSSSMSTADAFTAKMMSVANYSERLRAMLFKARFYDRVTEIKPDIDSVNLASEEVKSSKKLMKILEIVLATGNYMNKGSTTMSGASGFKISFLTKLISTKTSDNKSTLLHVIVNTIKNNKSELLDVKEELPHVALAAKVSSQMLSMEITELRTGMKEINDTLKSYAAKEGDSDRYKDVIGKFVKDAKKQLEELLDSYEKMKASFSSTTEFYSESKITTEDFFGAFAVFLQHLENVKKDVMSEEEKREYQARKEKELEEMRKRRNSTVNHGRTLSNASLLSVSENEVKTGFDAVLRDRSLSQGSKESSESKESNVIIEPRTENSKSLVDESPALALTKSKVGAEMKSGKPKSDTTVIMSVDSSKTGPKLVGNAAEEGIKARKLEKQSSVQGPPDTIRVLPHTEANTLARLLKRRERIEDTTDSERDRADSSASDASFFSTTPRTQFKLPPSVPKKSKPAPPPLKPKPKQGSIDFRSSARLRSISKNSSDDSEASKDSSSGGSLKMAEQGNTPERTWSPSANGSFKNVHGDRNGRDVKESINGRKIVPTAKNVTPSVPSLKVEISPEMEKTNRSSAQKEIAGKSDSVLKPSKKAASVIKETSPKSDPIVVNLGPDLPTYNVDVVLSDSEAIPRERSDSVKPAKPARKSNEPFKITPYEQIEMTKQQNVNGCSHDPEDYDNLPLRNTNDDEHDEPDYALPVLPESLNTKVFVETNTNEDSTEGSHYTADIKEGDHYTALKIDDALRNNIMSKVISRQDLPDDDVSDSEQYSLTSKNLNNKLNRANLLRNSSLSSSQSSDSDSPKSYRRYKQNRMSTPKNKSSTIQKLKGVINGMRSRSSSEASTTSIEPVPSLQNSSLTKSPRPILKKFNQSPEHSLDFGTMNRSNSPRTVKFQDLPSPTHDVIKLSTDDESLPEYSVKIPPVPNMAAPAPPTEPVPPPMPPPYHLRNKSPDMKMEDESSVVADNKPATSVLSMQVSSPPPPPFKPPPPPKKTKPVIAELSPLSPTLPQFKPAPPPSLSKMKTTAPSSTNAAPLPGSVTSADDKIRLEHASSVISKKPPPPPKRGESIKQLSPTPNRTAALPLASIISAASSQLHPHVLKNRQVEKNHFDCPTPPPELATTPLDDIAIVPPPPSPSPPKAGYLSDMSTGRDDENRNEEKPRKQSITGLSKPNFMIKVLPTGSRLLSRENEIYQSDTSEHTSEDTGSGSSPSMYLTPDYTEGNARTQRTDSLSSLSSNSFPPLPSSSLLDTVEEDDLQYHTVFQF